MKRYLLFLLLIGMGFHPRCFAQASPYSLNVFKAQSFTATGQMGTPIQLNGLIVSSTIGSSYASGTITLTGVGLTTVTFQVMGSSDNGVTYYPLPVNAIATPSTTATTTTATTNGLYQINLAGLTHVKFVTSGTFTATSVSFTLTASPNALTSRNGGALFPSGSTGFVFNTGPTTSVSATPANLSALVAGLSGCSTTGNVWSPSSSNCVSPTGSGAALGTLNQWGALQLLGTSTPFSANSGSLLFASNPMTTYPSLQGQRIIHGMNSPITSSHFNIVVIGDSTLAANGETDKGNGPVAQFMLTLKQRGFNIAGTGIVPVTRAISPNGTLSGSGFNSGFSWSGSLAGASIIGDFGPGVAGTGGTGVVVQLISANSLTWRVPSYLSTIGGDEVEVMGETNASTGNCTVTVDGTTTLSTTVGGSSASPAVFFTILPIPGSGTKTLHSTVGVSGTCAIYGAGIRSSLPGVEVHNLAVNSTTSSQWAATPATGLAFVQALNPVSNVTALGINDIAICGTTCTATTYQTNLTNIINTLQTANPFVTILLFDENNTADPPSSTLSKTQVIAIEKQLAATFGVQYVSTSETWGTYAQAAAQGLMFDTRHPNDKGGQNQGALLSTALIDSTPNIPPPANNAYQTGYIKIPNIYSMITGGATASGTTVTLTVAGQVFGQPLGLYNVVGCSDINYNVSGINLMSFALTQYNQSGINSLPATTVTYTSPGTPGASTTGCDLVPQDIVLDASFAQGNDAFFDLTIPFGGVIHSLTMLNAFPGLHGTLNITCNASGGACQSSNPWPSFLLSPPPMPTAPTSTATASFVVSAVTPTTVTAYQLSSPIAVTSTPLAASSVAAGACQTLTAAPTAAMQAQHIFFLQGQTYKTSFTAAPGPAFDVSQVFWAGSALLDILVCNHSPAAATPAVVSVNVSN